jgi:hypothetical protein
VSTVDGQTYERVAIETWLDEHATSPLTGSPLSSTALVPNLAVKSAIERLQASAAPSRLPSPRAAHPGPHCLTPSPPSTQATSLRCASPASPDELAQQLAARSSRRSSNKENQ